MFYQKGCAYSPWERGQKATSREHLHPWLAQRAPHHQSGSGSLRALSTNTANTEGGAGTRFCNPQNRTFHQLETESASPGCPGGNSNVSSDPGAGPPAHEKSALCLRSHRALVDPSSARWPAHPARLPPRQIPGRAAVAPGTPRPSGGHCGSDNRTLCVPPQRSAEEARPAWPPPPRTPPPAGGPAPTSRADVQLLSGPVPILVGP